MTNLKEMNLTRTFNAPVALVWKAWTEPKHLEAWWGPEHFSGKVNKLEIKTGGVFGVDMVAPDGTVLPGGGTFQEVIEFEKLVVRTTAFEDENGVPKLEAISTVTFKEDNGKTVLNLHSTLVKMAPEMAAAADGMEEGWSQSLDKLVNHINKVAA